MMQSLITRELYANPSHPTGSLLEDDFRCMVTAVRGGGALCCGGGPAAAVLAERAR